MCFLVNFAKFLRTPFLPNTRATAAGLKKFQRAKYTNDATFKVVLQSTSNKSAQAVAQRNSAERLL